MRKWIALLLCVTLLCGCSGAGTGGEERTGTGEGVAFTDDLGRTVAVEDPQRVAVLIGSFAQVWCLAGGKEQLVATANDAWTQFDLELSEEVVNLGATKELNLELLLASEPDFVIASCNTGTNVELLDTFEAAGLNVAYFRVSTIEEYLHMLDICTQITGDREAYEKYGLTVEKQAKAAQARADGSAPTVLYIRASGSGCKVKNSRNSVLGEMLADMGCVNIADSQTSLMENLNMEVILQLDPEHIFVVMQGSDPEKLEQVVSAALLEDPAWQSLSAVKEGRLHRMDQTLFNLKPNARWGEAYDHLADILYP